MQCHERDYTPILITKEYDEMLMLGFITYPNNPVLILTFSTKYKTELFSFLCFNKAAYSLPNKTGIETGSRTCDSSPCPITIKSSLKKRKLIKLVIQFNMLTGMIETRIKLIR